MSSSWRDVLVSRGINVEAKIEARKRSESGCVVRSLESITGAIATDEEWRLRFEQLDRLSFDTLFTTYLATNDINVFRGVLERDIEQVLQFIQMLSESDSQMGRALSEYVVIQDKLSAPELIKTLQKGSQVMVMAEVNERGVAHYAHAAHIVLTDTQQLVSKSDNSLPISIRQGKAVNMAIFEQRKNGRRV